MSDRSALKQHLFREIDRRQDELVQLLQVLLQFNTENPPGNSRPIAEYIASYLSQAGVVSNLHAAPGDHYNLTADIETGRAGKRLLFCGHTDVVPAGDPSRWSFPPFVGDVSEGFVRGRGASDMKGGLAAFLFAALLLKEFEDQLAGSIGLVVVDDEEAGGEYGARWLLAQGAVQGDGCIIAEPSGPLNPTIGQKGSCWFEVSFTGIPAHGSLAPLAGESAIVKAAAAVQQLQKLHAMPVKPPQDIAEALAASKAYLRLEGRAPVADILDHVSVNVGVVQGGTKTNVVPDHCSIQVDSRVPFGLTHEDVMAEARRLLDQLGYAYQVRPLGFWGAANYTRPDDPVVAALLQGIRDARGGSPYGVLQWASSDARHFRAHGIPVLQYGPAELATIHSWDERVRVTDLVAAAKTYSATAVEYLLA